ncbi:MAG: diadenylate cyclase CdaA [Oscillospiraceae bacterium]|nr:diadenylate cyclase CdaA [Oscillospiraceae bacterium]
MTGFLSDVNGIIKSFGIPDLVDIIVVAYLFYHLFRFIRETRAMQLLKGVLLLAILYSISDVAGFRTLTYLMKFVFQYGAFAILIVLQPELRSTLDHVGRTKFSTLGFLYSNSENDEYTARMKKTIADIGEASDYLSKRRIGALIVIERQTKLGEIVKTGTVVNADSSAEMLGSLFFPNSPLHDGAVVIRDGRICAAGCYLPLSENYTINREMGTRHRAGLGMSENSDAVVVIVSEETGIITIAEGGKLRRGFTAEQLVRELNKHFSPEKDEKSEKKKSILNNLSKVKR